MGDLFDGNADRYHRRFRLRADEDDLIFSSCLEIHTLELAKFEIPAERLESGLERWTYFLKNGKELDPERLPQDWRFLRFTVPWRCWT